MALAQEVVELVFDTESLSRESKQFVKLGRDVGSAVFGSGLDRLFSAVAKGAAVGGAIGGPVGMVAGGLASTAISALTLGQADAVRGSREAFINAPAFASKLYARESSDIGRDRAYAELVNSFDPLDLFSESRNRTDFIRESKAVDQARSNRLQSVVGNVMNYLGPNAGVRGYTQEELSPILNFFADRARWEQFNLREVTKAASDMVTPSKLRVR